jgi:hypothetical protein
VVLAQFGAELLSVSASEHGTKAVRLNMEPMAVRLNMEPMAVREGCVLFTKRMLSNERREEMAMLIPCVNLRGSAAFFLGGSAVDAVLEQQ